MENKDQNNPPYKKKKLSTLQTSIFFIISLALCAGCALVIHFLSSQKLYRIYENDYFTLIKESNENICRKYSIYALDDASDDYNMDILSHTNFRYGIIHSDHFEKLDLEDLGNYEVQNFDDDFDVKNLFVYSCYLDKNTFISYDMRLFGHATLTNTFNHYNSWQSPFQGILYNYNNNMLYLEANGYLFPIVTMDGCHIDYPSSRSQSSVSLFEAAENGKFYMIADDAQGGDEKDDDSMQTVNLDDFQSEVMLTDNHSYAWKHPEGTLYIPILGGFIALNNVDISDYSNLEDYGTLISTVTDSSYFFDPMTLKVNYSTPVDYAKDSYYVVSYVKEPLDSTSNDLFVQSRRIINLSYRFRYLPIILCILFGISGIVFFILSAVRTCSFFFGFIRQNIPLTGKLILFYTIYTVLEILGILFLDNLIRINVEQMLFIMILEKVVLFPLLLVVALQINRLTKESAHLANGELDHSFETKGMFFDFQKLGNNLNQIHVGIQTALDERMKSEHFKTELITNVSHDIKTPLTSIVNYVDLLKKENIKTPNSAEYLEVLERQSIKLKKLLENLIEATKASTGSITVDYETCDLSVLLSQIAGEYEEKFTQRQISLCVTTPEEPALIKADNKHLQRICDNLMTNIYKYAQPMTRAYLHLVTKDGNVYIIFRNISEAPLNISADSLMERFVRGDASRSSEGHGLGLTIAQSLTELMGGSFQLEIDGDLFKVTLRWPLVEGDDSSKSGES